MSRGLVVCKVNSKGNVVARLMETPAPPSQMPTRLEPESDKVRSIQRRPTTRTARAIHWGIRRRRDTRSSSPPTQTESHQIGHSQKLTTPYLRHPCKAVPQEQQGNNHPQSVHEHQVDPQQDRVRPIQVGGTVNPLRGKGHPPSIQLTHTNYHLERMSPR